MKVPPPTPLFPSRNVSLMDSAPLPPPILMVDQLGYVCGWYPGTNGAIPDLSFFSYPFSIRNVTDALSSLTYHSYQGVSTSFSYAYPTSG